jgi:hypothetical protein
MEATPWQAAQRLGTGAAPKEALGDLPTAHLLDQCCS